MSCSSKIWPAAICLALAPATAQAKAPLCATETIRQSVTALYDGNPILPPVIFARRLGIPEELAVSALPESAVMHGVSASPELVRTVWSSINEWGRDSLVHLVFSSGGRHVADFTSLTPIAQPDAGDGLLKISADNGKGAQGTIVLDQVEAIYSLETTDPERGTTRMVSFYGDGGELIIGLYASMGKKEADSRAIAGFERTARLLRKLPSICG